MKNSILVSAIFLAFVISANARPIHPSDDCIPQPISDARLARFQKFPQEAWINGLTFRPCSKKAAELTASERYLLAGLQPETGTVNHPESWMIKVELFAWAYYGIKHSLPTQIDRDGLSQIGMVGEANDANAEWYKSPITGEYPKLDNPDFSPGGVYLRALTPDETRHLAQWNQDLAALLTVKKRIGNKPAETSDAVMLDPVIYYRFYGEKGLLKEGISYLFAPVPSSAPTSH